MNETAGQRLARQDRQGKALAAFLRAGPHEPLVTREEVLTVPCPVIGCGAQPGEECDGTFPHPVFASGIALRGMSGVHLSRYQDVTHDPR